jgi:hypothetical protein
MKRNMCSCRKSANLSTDIQNAEVPNIPIGCICDIDSWGCLANIKPICTNYISSDETEICQNCEHEFGCHNISKKDI